ncbi:MULTISPECIES: hypothetical protein [Calothrix]|uniref:Uncharacterized protein n=2 Tax=Calothrix TaxID=1186 RepID=A0ABR8AIM6_9CYAN|nr:MULTISPECIES: hypothetical protein [Calothrix]MBD2199896.1 hypothetical protein [Calothrix parietina FACHB-288]MBD2228757.1 hypothetical protein [Calothrix anomala FACHB-343]
MFPSLSKRRKPDKPPATQHSQEKLQRRYSSPNLSLFSSPYPIPTDGLSDAQPNEVTKCWVSFLNPTYIDYID